HFAWVSNEEGVVADPEALMLIARAAEGSARDGLSILDQAIAHAGLEGGGVTADAVRQMLGLSDRGAVRDLLTLILAGDGAGALASMRRQYDYGVDPLSVLRSLLETVHGITLTKVGTPADAAQPMEERAAREEWAASLGYPALHRLWQLFLKGHDEVAKAALPIEAAEMALLRAIYASTLPDPGELARQIASGAAPSVASTAAPPPTPPSGEAPPWNAGSAAKAPEPVATGPILPPTFEALVDLLDESGGLAIAARLRHGARIVSYAPPEFVLSGSRPVSADTLAELNTLLKSVTRTAWKVSIVDAPGAPTLREAQDAADAAVRQAILESPIMKAAVAAFPDAQLESWPGQRSNA
ncbi:MAG: DNA polymerase III subunit gamma/tau, partial [Sphingomonas sp.]